GWGTNHNSDSSYKRSLHPQRYLFQWVEFTANNAHMDTDFSRAWKVLKNLTRAPALFWLGTSVVMVGVAYWFSRSFAATLNLSGIQAKIARSSILKQSCRNDDGCLPSQDPAALQSLISNA